jgi:hypothetical protein
LTASLLESPISLTRESIVGSQSPTVRSSPAYVSTLGDEAADLMEDVGKPLMPWQREFLRDAFGRRADGSFASFELGLFVARQNGKGVIIEAMELYALYMLKEEQIIHSAHLFATSQKSFQRLKDLIEGSDWLRKRTLKPRESHGTEGFKLIPSMGGGMLDYKARTKHAARGFTGNRIVLDEAYSLEAPDMSAMTPTLLSIPNAQLCYFSSPPDDETGPMPANAFLPSVRAGGKAGVGRITYWEWSPPKGANASSPQTWALTNPSLGYLISAEAVRDQYTIYQRANRLDKFATEMLGAWPDSEAAQWQVISELEWNAAHDPASATVGRPSLAVYVTPDRRTTCIGAAGVREDGDLSFGWYAYGPGTDWAPGKVVEAVRELSPCRLVIDKAGAGANLVIEVAAALKEAELDIEVTTMTSGEVGQAYGMVKDALTRSENAPVWRLWHRGQPEMTAAVAGAMTRSLGREGTTWDTLATSADLSPIIAGTNAVWGYVTRPDDQPFFGSWR